MSRLPIILGVIAIITSFIAWFPRFAHDAGAAKVEAKRLGKKVDVAQVAGLTVATWDEASTSAKIIEVKYREGRWLIASHYDYPADAKARAAKLVAGYLDVELSRPVTTDPKDFEELGVIDPLDQDLSKKLGRGKHVKLIDATGGVLVDVIVGKNDEHSAGLYYVRENGQNAVYTAKIDSDVSTRFVDYVEDDPFKLNRDDLRGVAVRDYSVDVKSEADPIVERGTTAIARPSATGDWTSPQVPADKRLAKGAVDGLIGDLAAMRLIGVRPFDPQWLSARGFYLTNQQELMAKDLGLRLNTEQGQAVLIGTEGRTDVTTKDGLRYSFLFGQVALDDDSDKAADASQGKKTDDKKADDHKPDDKRPEDQKEDKKDGNRYMAVFVQYDPNADEVAKAEAEQAKLDAAKPAEEAAKAKAEADAKKGKSLSGAERSRRAQERFSKFFYVISDSSFKALRPAREKLFEAKPAEPMAGNTGKTNSAWLEENGKRAGVKTTASGLQYEVLTPGPAEGVSPAATDTVEVKYKGTLVDGTEFDSSKDGTASFAVNGVIKGWTEALQLMKPSDKWKLFIPPAIAYGEAGQGSGEAGSPPKIGANAILIFEVELVKTKASAK